MVQMQTMRTSSLCHFFHQQETNDAEKGKKKPKPKEMTEEEMMDLALRLSAQEASVSALHQQQEEEAVLKAIQESMVDQTQPCPTSQSQTVLTDASFRLGSRRKLSYSTGKKATVVGVKEDDCSLSHHSPSSLTGGRDANKMEENQERRAGSPLLEMPDLSQTQKISSQTSQCSVDPLSAPLDSQNSDSTQIDDCQLPTSPVFPLSGSRVKVHVNRLSQNLLDTCTSSGFVLYSQDRWTETQKSQKSPSKTHVSLKVSQEDCVETQLSPVFGRSTQHEKTLSASKPHVSACSPTPKNSGFMFSSQESLTDSVSNTFSPTKSPVFPSGPGPSKNIPLLEFPKSPDGEETEQSPANSPVFGSTTRQHVAHTNEKLPSGAELRVPKGGTSPRQSRETSNKDGRHDTITPLSNSEELNESSKDRNSAETEFSSNMMLVWSDGSDNDDGDVTPAGSPSPVFPEETPVQASSLNHAASSEAPNCSLNPQRCAPSTDKQASSGTSSQANGQRPAPITGWEGQEQHPVSSQGVASGMSCPYREPADRQTVHYYWGVPFCPRGLDPDKYTQVILAQMDVYEKSLKQAQRCLLRKAEWGEAILPQPEKSPSPESPAESPQFHAPRRRGLKRRAKTLSEAAESPSAEAGEEEDKEEEEERKEENKEEKAEEDEEPMDTEDCEVCPETQLSDDSTQVLMMAADGGAEVSQQPPPKSPETPEVEMILQEDSPVTVEPQAAQEEEEEEDVLLDEKMEGNRPVCSRSDAGGQTVRTEEVEEGRKDPDVEEVAKRRLQRSMSPELEPAVVPQNPETSVDCPICQASFPASRIEMHAAFCDGEVDDRKSEAHCFQVSPKPRRKRTRRAQVNADETNNPVDCERNQEKCYICQKGIPLQDYSRHTELCIQRQVLKPAAKGNLLSALEQTESRDSEAGPSGSKLQSGDVIELLDDDDDDEEEQHISAVRVSDSPIRSFTPISEATDCLVDFKKQHPAKRLSQRRR
ncbi:BRCA1-A complex subunit RAP80 isoform X2 [Parambassis ranga]|uniref:BRCA1-A complex subunit RAP80 isoform X2 n=1 Tax=Parambassis ranga TaxID=210632 RepID=A0A6P7JNB1_9TELE|nr:BRCA1-A complex subunit RAP80 isoform X2 [Parambassis ranga]